LFKKNDQGFGVLGPTAALSIGQALPNGATSKVFGQQGSHLLASKNQFSAKIARTDWVPDLGADMGSSQWFRGLVTCVALCSSALYLSPRVMALPGRTAPVLSGKAWDEARAQTVMPLAFGADTGRRMGATAMAVPISDTPERATIELMATLGQGDGFARVLERIGVASSEAQRVATMVSSVTPLAEIPSGSVMPIILGERASRDAPRPLQSLDLRARFDTKLEFRRVGNSLTMRRVAIAVDRTPLRIQGVIGNGLYRSARAAGVPAQAIESYIRIIAAKASLNDAVPGARFDIILENAKSATGESQPGKLLYAGLSGGGRTVRLIEWRVNGRSDWFEEGGVSQRQTGMVSPVPNARLSSGFGMRVHPVLGYSRFHRGVDYAAVQGTPVYAVTNGLVAFAGRYAGYGNHIRLSHSSSLGTSYSHLSRIAVSPGSRVSQGQLIGYVGSTGMSTGPHLHFEVYSNGAPVNPRAVNFATESLLNGKELAAFRNQMSALMAVPISGAAR
jgi:murein DD-endopeptidase MepM/ murein hydrolase activator NlpD